MNKFTLFSLLAMSMLPLSGLADDTKGQRVEVGEQTRSLLELQRSNSAASSTPRPMSGEVARQTWERYRNTHGYEIPESFSDEEQSFVQD